MTCEAPDRIYNQYRDKPNIVTWLGFSSEMLAPLCETADVLRRSYQISTATGELLDIIGRIVVAPNSTVDDQPLEVWEWDDFDKQWGDFSAMFSAKSTGQDEALNAENHRLVIRSKIEINNGDATIDDIITGVLFVASGAIEVHVTDNEDMTFDVLVVGSFTETQRRLLLDGQLIPKPQGVRINSVTIENGVIEFNTDGQNEFGDEAAEFAFGTFTG